MTDRLRSRWFRKRYNKKVKVEVEAEETPDVATMKPLIIIDGLESFEGAQPVEINFENVHDMSDIEIDHENVEIESVDLEDNKVVAWIYDNFTPETSFYIYYGRNNEWATAYDDEFKRERLDPETEGYDCPYVHHIHEDGEL